MLIDLSQRCIMLGLLFWLPCLLATLLSSSARSMSYGRRVGSSTLLRSAYGCVTLIRSWYRYVLLSDNVCCDSMSSFSPGKARVLRPGTGRELNKIAQS